MSTDPEVIALRAEVARLSKDVSDLARVALQQSDRLGDITKALALLADTRAQAASGLVKK